MVYQDMFNHTGTTPGRPAHHHLQGSEIRHHRHPEPSLCTFPVRRITPGSLQENQDRRAVLTVSCPQEDQERKKEILVTADGHSELHHHDCLFLFAEFPFQVAGVKLVALPGIIIIIQLALVEHVHELF